jgi:hypothetical protein
MARVTGQEVVQNRCLNTEDETAHVMGIALIYDIAMNTHALSMEDILYGLILVFVQSLAEMAQKEDLEIVLIRSQCTVGQIALILGLIMNYYLVILITVRFTAGIHCGRTIVIVANRVETVPNIKQEPAIIQNQSIMAWIVLI